MPAHSKLAKSHEENRKCVCAPCGIKLKQGDRILTLKNVDFIIKHINPEFNFSNRKFPKGICNGCRKKFDNYEKEKSSLLPSMPNYEEMVVPRQCIDTIKCSCYLCLQGLSKAKKTVHVGGRGNVNNRCITITAGQGLNGLRPNNSLPSTVKEKSSNNTISICKNCLQEVGKGIKHVCKSSKSSQNLKLHCNNLPKEQTFKLVSNLLRENEPTNKGDCLHLPTLGGKKMRISVNPKPKKDVKFSNEDLANLQGALGNMSDRNMKVATNFIRCKAGRNSIPTGHRNEMSSKSKEFEAFYHKDTILLDGYGNTEVSRPIVYADAKELVSAVSSARGYTDPIIKVMADGGQKFLKFCISLIPRDYIDEKENCVPSTRNRKSTYSAGGTAAKRAKGELNGVKRLLMLCIIPDVPETHKNLQIVFNLTNLNSIEYSFVGDFKLLLVALGKQTATSTYPCPYCDIQLQLMRRTDPLDLVIPSIDDIKELTFNDLQQDHQKFVYKVKGNIAKARLSKSTINECLIKGEANLIVLEKCPFDELHCLQGYVNHVFFDGLVKAIGLDNALEWPTMFHLSVSSYHGGQFEGNACRKLLNSAQGLKQLKGDEKVLQIYFDAFTSYNALVSNLYSNSKVYVDQDCIHKMLVTATTDYMKLGITVTLKVHIVFNHLEEMLKHCFGLGLGLFSAQAIESSHREFLQSFWSKHEIKSLDNPRYLDNLMKAAVEFTSKHK